MYEFPPKSNVLGAGEMLEYVSAGGGACSVVLVNGAGGPIEGWYRIFDPVAGFAKVFAFNRPGIGGSAKPGVPQTAGHMVASLRMALQAVRMPPPYVLVGHSFGGLIVNLFARLYPDEVTGAVFVEATAPEAMGSLETLENAAQGALKSLLQRLFPPHCNAETVHAHSSASELMRAPAFPTIPLIVITGGKPALAWATPAALLAARAAHQRKLVHLSPLGKQIFAPRSGHFPQLSEPELVVAAIAEIAGVAYGRDVPLRSS